MNNKIFNNACKMWELNGQRLSTLSQNIDKKYLLIFSMRYLTVKEE
jgi:hypothetical protein